MIDLEIALLKARTSERGLAAQMAAENKVLREHLGSLTRRLTSLTDAVERIERADAVRIRQLQRLLLEQAQPIPGAKLNSVR